MQPTIGISSGDPSGIGLEVTLKALPAVANDARWILYTDNQAFDRHYARFGAGLPYQWIRTPAEARMRILEGRRRQVEERRESLREAVARATSSLDRYTRQLHQLGLESSEREVKWLNELIAAERVAQGRAEQQP